jgi:hypothetical protein
MSALTEVELYFLKARSSARFASEPPSANRQSTVAGASSPSRLAPSSASSAGPPMNTAREFSARYSARLRARRAAFDCYRRQNLAQKSCHEPSAA